MASKNDERHLFFCIAHRRVIDRHSLAARLMNGDAALRAWYHQILDPHVCKRAAGHHPVVSAPTAIAIEILGLNSSGHQILTGWRSRLDGAGRRNMIGRYRVAENSQSARAEDILDLPTFIREFLKNGRLWM